MELNKKNISEQIVDIIIEEIRVKKLLPGDKLPNERELATNMGVSRVPLREALRALNNMGILTTKRGEGTFVNEYDPDKAENSLRLYSMLDEAPIKEMMQLRKIMEQETARLAALMATDEDIARIRTYKELREEKHYNELADTGYADKYHEMDMLFHRAIALATGNSVYINFLDIIRNSINFHQNSASSRSGMFEITTMHHDKIFWAIANHEPDKAAKAMLEHLEEVEKEVEKEISKIEVKSEGEKKILKLSSIK